MARWRLGVALLLDGALGGGVDLLRRALGEDDVDRVPPHLTLVPPVNVRGDALPTALAVVRAAAGGVEPFSLTLGPVTTFDPVTPTIHLAVAGDLEMLLGLRGAVRQGPLLRESAHSFVPHVTLVESAPLHRIRAAVVALRDHRVAFAVQRLTVLAEERSAAGRRRWRPVADVDLDGVRVVGRGGLPTELAAGTLVDPEARRAHPDVPGVVDGPVVTARREGVVVGVGWRDGWCAAEPEVGHLVAGEVAWRAGWE